MPFLAPLVPLAVGGIASAAAGGGGGGDDSGPNNQQITDAVNASNRRDNDFSYGGTNGQSLNPNFDRSKPESPQNPRQLFGMNGAQQAVQRYQGMGDQWANMSAPGTDYGVANGYMGRSDQSRDSQLDSLGLMRNAAYGNAPSQAQIMMAQGNDQAMANQQAMAAGARGPAAMAMAQQQAMGNQSAMSTNNMNNMGAMRAQEMAAARGAYGQMGTTMRQGDLASQQQAAQQAQYLSDMQMRQRQLAQSGQLGFNQLGNNVNIAQLGARGASQGADAAAHALQVSTDAASTNHATDTGLALTKMGLEAVNGH